MGFFMIVWHCICRTRYWKYWYLVPHRMKVKHLESALSSLQREFPNPNVALEQYPTSAHLAARVIAFAAENGDLGSGMTWVCFLRVFPLYLKYSQIYLAWGVQVCGSWLWDWYAYLCCRISVRCCNRRLVFRCWELTVLSFACSVPHWVLFSFLPVDCDIEALCVAQENACSVELDDTINFIQAIVRIGSNSIVATRGASKQKGTGRGHGRGQRPPQRNTKELLIEGLGDGIPMKDNCVDSMFPDCFHLLLVCFHSQFLLLFAFWKAVISNPPFGTKVVWSLFCIESTALFFLPFSLHFLCKDEWRDRCTILAFCNSFG